MATTMKSQMCSCWRTALLTFLLLFSAAVHAQTDAYSVEVAVADKSDTEQRNAYQVALRRVLRNTSGDKTVLNRDLVRQELKQAINFVKGFSYRTPPPGTVISSDTPITERVRQSGQATQLMLISFDRQLVAELIESSAPARANTEDQDAPPAVALNTDSALLWLLIQDDGRDIRVSDPAAANIQRRAREIAGAAGISLVYPTGDAEDQLALTVDDMLSQDFNKLAVASERYGQDMILSGTLARRGAQGWLGEWVRLLGTEMQQSSFETATLDEALKEGLQVLNSIAAIDETYRYGGNAQSGTEGLVWVGSVTSTDDYARVINFLQDQPAVSTVYPKEVSDTAIVFSIVPRSALTDISAAAANAPWLRRSAPPVVSPVDNSVARNADLALEFNR
jgi:hypothetical protein